MMMTRSATILILSAALLFGPGAGLWPVSIDHFSRHGAVKILNSYGLFASLSDANTMLLPSGENSGNAVKPPKLVTCSRPVPSTLIRYNSNLRLSHACLLEENRMRLPSGVNVGAKLAQP